jgi:hypothetical protein
VAKRGLAEPTACGSCAPVKTLRRDGTLNHGRRAGVSAAVRILPLASIRR